MTPSSPDPDPLSARVPVSLGARSYDIVIDGGLLDRADGHIRKVLRNPRVAIVTDETVAELHLQTLKNALDRAGVDSRSFVFPPGEGSKNIATYAELMDDLLDARLQRDEALIALGGGVIGDLTGFAAATLRRGVDFIQIPTTLLSQVDSSVGG